MSTQQKVLVGFVLALLISVGVNLYLVSKPINKNQIGGNSDLDFPCIYNSGSRTLQDGQGTAFSCDANGRVIITN